MRLDDLEIYLPKYLSADSDRLFRKAIRDFADREDQSLYTRRLEQQPIIYQGDGLVDLPYLSPPNTEVKSVQAMVLSNTCDVDQENPRNRPSRIVYAPIQSISSYSAMLKKTTAIREDQLAGHLQAIRRQEPTQLFYLPSYGEVLPESVVHLDYLNNLSNDAIDRKTLSDQRLFTLSDFGAYLFVLKLSVHFCRIQDKVDRGTA